jgi:hypothetical protein
MKRFFLLIPAAVILGGCASTESGHVSRTADGTRVYGLNEQPETSVTGAGALMPGAYSSHNLATGQFTGQERTHAVIGQKPVTPREADARALARNAPPALGSGAGTLGQTGIVPSGEITSSTLVDLPPNLATVAGDTAPGRSSTATANPPTLSSAPTLAQPLTGENPSVMNGIGGAPGAQSGTSTSLSNNISRRGEIPRADEALRSRAVGAETTTFPSAAEDLPARVREALTTGRPDTITRLTPNELQRLQIDAANGNVTLRGDVRSETEKLMIGNKIAQMQGVRSVNNQLRVTGPSPAAIREQTGTPAPETGVRQ